MPVAVGLALGKWQLDRKSWKEDLIRHRSSVLAAEPVQLSDEVFDRPDEFAYHKFNLHGSILHTNRILVGPRMAPKNAARSSAESWGFLAVSPMALDNGRVVAVVEGWVPKSINGLGLRNSLQVKDIVCILRGDEEVTDYTPSNSLSSGNFFSIKASDLKKAWELDDDIIIFERLPDSSCEASQLPCPREPSHFVSFRTTPDVHLVYASTWIGCSIAWAFLTFRRFIK